MASTLLGRCKAEGAQGVCTAWRGKTQHASTLPISMCPCVPCTVPPKCLCAGSVRAHAMHMPCICVHMHRGRVEEARQRHIDDDVQRVLVYGEGPLGRVHLHGRMHTWWICMCACYACPTALTPCVRCACAVRAPCVRRACAVRVPCACRARAVRVPAWACHPP